MQRACWQDEDEAFDDGPIVQHTRTKAPWENHSMTSTSRAEDDEKRRIAQNVRVKPLWAPPSEADLDAQFEKELAAAEYQMATPWDQVRPGDNSQVLAAQRQATEERNSNYKYTSMWAVPEMTASRLEQLACYSMAAPFEREGDEPPVDPVFEAKRDKHANQPRTLAPWKYGQEPGKPVKEKKERKDTNLWMDLGEKKEPPREPTMASSGDPILDTVREKLMGRAHDINGMARRFKIMDDDRSGSLNFTEFRKGLKECQVGITEMQIKHVFNLFDRDDNGSVGYEEFLVGLRGTLNPRRVAIVRAAFRRMDKDANGFVDMTDIKRCFNAQGHPEVIQRIKTEDQVLRELLDNFESGLAPIPAAATPISAIKAAKAAVGGAPVKFAPPPANIKGDGIVTLDEFCSYYANISASIDDDDYFELMIRNAWHMSGGKGWAANTTVARVLVTAADGTQSIQEAKKDSMSNDYSRSFGVAGDKGSNTKGRQLMHQDDEKYSPSAAAKPVAGVATAVLSARREPFSAPGTRRPSDASHHSTSSAPNMRSYGMGAGPGANLPPQKHVFAKQLPGPGLGHIRGMPDRSSWATNPGAAADHSTRVLKEIANTGAAPTSLAAALMPKQDQEKQQQPEAVLYPMKAMGARPPPRADPTAALTKNVAPTYSPDQLAQAAQLAAKRQQGVGQPKSLRDQLSQRSMQV